MEEETSMAQKRIAAYRMGRKRRGDIRVFLLWALTDHPMHGYELMQFLAEKTYGLWHPSPGSVYPTLEMLEEQGLVTSEQKDGKKVYTITEAGRKSSDAMNDGAFANDPQQRDAIKNLRESTMLIRRILRAIITRGSVADLQKAAQIMHETRARLVKVFGTLPQDK